MNLTLRRAMLLCAFVPLLVAPGTLAYAQKGNPKTAVTTDVSDLWWNPSESGWGMQLVQEGNFVFATVFV